MTKPLAIFPTRTTAAPGIEVITDHSCMGFVTVTMFAGQMVASPVRTLDQHSAIDAHLDAILAVRQASVRLTLDLTAADPDVIATTVE